LEVVLDLLPITIKTNGVSIFSSLYEICHKKKGFFICFFTWLKGYDGWCGLTVLLGKLNAEIVTANPKGASGLGCFSGREVCELDEGEALNRAKVWGRNVHVLGDIDVADGAIRGEGGAEGGLKIVRIAWQIAKNDGLTGL